MYNILIQDRSAAYNLNIKPENPNVVTHRGVVANSIYSQAFLFLRSCMSKEVNEAPLCKCGCGQKVKWNKWKNRWNEYLYAHNSRGKNWEPKPPDNEAPLCECGCGEKTKWSNEYQKWNRFIYSHSSKMSKKYPNYKNRPLCACGCGEPVNSYRGEWNRFVDGHSSRGKNNPCYGRTGDKHPFYGTKSPETTERLLKNNPMKNPEIAKKVSLKLSGENHPFYGKKIHSDEKKKELSRKWIANNPMCIPEFRAKISGENHWAYGKKHPEISERQRGENNSNWKGGISKNEYCPIWRDEEYKKSIRDRDNNECQNPNCWHTADHLHLGVHHIDGDKKNCNPKNLISLCRSCNTRAEGNKDVSREWWQELYQYIMTEKYGYEY